MFLNQLDYQEKKMFLDLCIHVAKANDELAKEEKELISSYCSEMQLPAIELYETEPLSTVLDYFSLADKHVKKIVMFEALGLAYVDGSFDEKEEEMVLKIRDSLGITKKDYDKIFKAINDYYKMIIDLAKVVE